MKTIRDPKVIDFIKNKNKEENSWAYSDDGEISSIPFTALDISLITWVIVITDNLIVIGLTVLMYFFLIFLWRQKIFFDIRVNFLYEIGYKNTINIIYSITYLVIPIFFLTFYSLGLIKTKLLIIIIVPFLNLFSFSFLFIFMKIKWIEHRYDEFKFEPDPNYISWEAMVQRYFDKR